MLMRLGYIAYLYLDLSRSIYLSIYLHPTERFGSQAKGTGNEHLHGLFLNAIAAGAAAYRKELDPCPSSGCPAACRDHQSSQEVWPSVIAQGRAPSHRRS